MRRRWLPSWKSLDSTHDQCIILTWGWAEVAFDPWPQFPQAQRGAFAQVTLVSQLEHLVASMEDSGCIRPPADYIKGANPHGVHH